jgi:predicted ATPase/DNA-binding CsgD family transcriptional regulator
VRLVTLVGPGGVGKTRLAVRVATELETGFHQIAFVPLAALRDSGLVEVTIARALGVDRADDGIAEGLRARLGSGPMLLLLDNFEHLVDAGPLLAELLRACPGLTVLVTSRARLRISGEHMVTVPPLPVPDPGTAAADDVVRYDAVRLFVERARSVDGGFALTEANAADVAEVCRRLDGLPLAIELAAAQVTVLAPAAMLARLDRRLPVLTDGPADLPERLRTMRAGIAWSYDLLPPAERRLFRRLAVFAGGCPMAGVERVAGDDCPAVLGVVGALVDKSLLQRDAGDAAEPRFTMLETIREYALDQLVAGGEEDAARRAHAEYFRALAERAEPQLRGPEQQRWRDALEPELDNFRAALSWTLRDAAGPEDADGGLGLVGALWYFWFQRGLTGEARRWLTRALDVATAGGRPRARALLGAGTLAWRQGDCGPARSYLDASAELWRAVGDEGGLAEALHVLGHVCFDQCDYRAAHGLFQESLEGYRRAGDVIGGLPLVGDLGLVAYHEGDYAEARAVFDDSLALYRRHGLKDRVAGVLNGLGDLARLAGDQRRATQLYKESLALWRELRGTPGIASALHKLGQVSRWQGASGQARERFTESLNLQRELGNQQGIAECLVGFAGLAADAGRPDRAAQVLAAGSALLEAIGMPLAPADQAVLEQDRHRVRDALGADAWASAWATGTALSTPDAIALATIDDASARGRGPGPLSRREAQVAALIAEGLTNRQISRTLSISEKTVGTHVEHIMTKLDVRSRTLIAVWAHEHLARAADPPSG